MEEKGRGKVRVRGGCGRAGAQFRGAELGTRHLIYICVRHRGWGVAMRQKVALGRQQRGAWKQRTASWRSGARSDGARRWGALPTLGLPGSRTRSRGLRYGRVLRFCLALSLLVLIPQRGCLRCMRRRRRIYFILSLCGNNDDWMDVILLFPGPVTNFQVVRRNLGLARPPSLATAEFCNYLEHGRQAVY